jgi:hypothetical protein
VIHYTSQVASEFGDSTIQIVSESGEVIYETSLPSNPVMAPIQSFQSGIITGYWKKKGK